MKKQTKVLFISALALGITSSAFSSVALKKSNFKAIQLNSGQMLSMKRDVDFVQFASDRVNKVDYIELREGSVIDSYDIKKLVPVKENKQRSHSKQSHTMGFRIGDGSGG